MLSHEVNPEYNQKDLFLLSLPYLDFDSDLMFTGQRFNEIKELAKTNEEVQSKLYNPTAFNFFSTHPLLLLDAYIALKTQAYVYNKGVDYLDEEVVSTGFIKEITQALQEPKSGYGVLRVSLNKEVNHPFVKLNSTALNLLLQDKMQQIAFIELADTSTFTFNRPFTLNEPLKSLKVLLKDYGTICTDYVQTEKLKIYLQESYYRDFIVPNSENFHDRIALMELGWEATGLSVPVQ